MTRFIPSYAERYDEQQISEITARFSVPPIVARALIRRGLVFSEEIEAFLHPERGELLPPEAQFEELSEAVDRIRQAALFDELICVYGDYDADGITATAILYSALKDIAENVRYFIPSRHDEGYGMHKSALDQLAAEGVTLIITVDNGIAAKDEIAYAAELGIDVIVTDHHQPQEGHPECVAVLSAAEECEEGALCGAGVAMKLALALLPDASEERFLPLAAIATISDMVPLIGENRTIVSKGLPLVANNVGVRALLASSDLLKRPVTETTVGFFVAPRLNAAGRIGDAGKAVELLLAASLEEALTLANALEADNTERRTQEAAIYSDALDMANGSFSASDRALVLKKEGWNVGVVGIVASRLVENYHVPALVFSESDGELTGSGRSIQGVNLFEALYACRDRFVRFGGHEMAAGVTMKDAEFESFRADLENYLTETYDASAFTPSYSFEESVLLKELSLDNVKALSLLAPFGEGNREPIYLVEGVELAAPRTMGREKTHLTAEAKQHGAVLRAVGFSLGRYAPLLALGDCYDLIATVSVNTYNGVSNPELYIKQLRRHPDGNGKIMDAFWRNLLYNEMYGHNAEEFFLLAEPYKAPFVGVHPDKPRMQALYRALKTALNGTEAFLSELASLLTPEELAAMLTFVELGFFAFDLRRGAVSVKAGAATRDLGESVLYTWLLRSKN